ncbi:MAG: InlB B-repeat-containing protein [Coprobacillaceae bacterium]
MKIKKYGYILQLELNSNYIQDISPLYTNYSFLYDNNPYSSEMRELHVSVLDQSVTLSVEFDNTEEWFSIANPITGLDSGILEPSFISNEGSYTDNYVAWVVNSLDNPSAISGTVYYEIDSVLPLNWKEQVDTYATPSPSQDRVLFRYGGSVTVEYTINQKAIQNYYQVMYHGNGHTSGDVPLDANQYLLQDTATILDHGTLVKDGYVFVEWNTSADGSGTGYQANDTISVSGQVDLYAIWKEKTDSITNVETPKDKITDTSDYTQFNGMIMMLIAIIGILVLRNKKEKI